MSRSELRRQRREIPRGSGSRQGHRVLSRRLSHGCARHRSPYALLIACLLSVGCAVHDREPTTPFHVAVVPVRISASPEARLLEGDATQIQLAFSEEQVSEVLRAALDEAFVKVTLLSPHGDQDLLHDRYEAWITEAREQGADLFLDATLTYHERVHTKLNDRFWLNLPLFALGGPGTWFVRDRSYYLRARLEAEFHDLNSVTGPSSGSRSDASHVVGLDEDIAEASLSFMDRADGVGDYALSCLLPGGWVAAESDAVPAALRKIIAEELCAKLARDVRGRVSDFTSPDRVDFRPVGVRTVHDGANRYLEGEIVLDLAGNADALDSSLRYRFDRGPFMEADWRSSTLESTSRAGKIRRYRFAIPIDADAGTIQLQVTQLDFDLSKRSFTYPIATQEQRESRETEGSP